MLYPNLDVFRDVCGPAVAGAVPCTRRHLKEQLVRVLKTNWLRCRLSEGPGPVSSSIAMGARYLDLLSGFLGVFFAIGRNHPALRAGLKEACLDSDLPNLVQPRCFDAPPGVLAERLLGIRALSGQGLFIPIPGQNVSKLRSSSARGATRAAGYRLLRLTPITDWTYGALVADRPNSEFPRRLRAAIARMHIGPVTTILAALEAGACRHARLPPSSSSRSQGKGVNMAHG